VKSKQALAVKPRAAADENVIVIDGRASRELFLRIAAGALRSGVEFLKAQMRGATAMPPARPLEPGAPDRDVMTADEVAAFLGVDRNTVYDYAGRGVIPHQRLGKASCSDEGRWLRG
jgi:excisionase family DNA binding protein